jgi:hypothetical protein
VPGTPQRPTAERVEFHRFELALLEKLRERQREGRLAPDEQVPDDLIEEVVTDLYGGWTDQARKFVRILEEKTR